MKIKDIKDVKVGMKFETIHGGRIWEVGRVYAINFEAFREGERAYGSSLFYRIDLEDCDFLEDDNSKLVEDAFKTINFGDKDLRIGQDIANFIRWLDKDIYYIEDEELRELYSKFRQSKPKRYRAIKDPTFEFAGQDSVRIAIDDCFVLESKVEDLPEFFEEVNY